MALRTWQRNGWSNRHIAAAGLMVLVGFIATRDAWRDIYYLATNDPENSHIVLVLLIAPWLLYIRRARWRQCRPVGQALGPILVLLGGITTTVGYDHAMDIFWHGGALMVVIGCLLSIVGRDVLFRFLPVFVVLLFLLPVPAEIRGALARNLQNVASATTEELMVLFGSNVTRNGTLLTINGQPLNVSEACNGMRGVFTIVLVSYAFAFSTPLRNYVRLIILAASPITVLLINIPRIISTVWVYGQPEDSLVYRGLYALYDLSHQIGLIKQYAHNEVGQFYHDLSGWLTIVLAFAVLMAIVYVLRWAMLPITQYRLAYD